jgi:hypothetical protein
MKLPFPYPTRRNIFGLLRLPTPLRCPLPGTPHLHPPGWAARGDHGGEPPQGVHGCGCHSQQPRRHGRPPNPGAMATPSAACPGSPAASKRVFFSDLLVSSPSQQEQPRICPGTVFLLPHWEVLHAPGWQLLHSLYKGSTLSVSGNRLRGSTPDLICSTSEASAGGGALCRLPTTLVLGQTSMATTLYSSTLYTVYTVQYLYISLYVYSNKLVLS